MSYNPLCLSVSNHKLAALFFDNFFPFNINDEILEEDIKLIGALEFDLFHSPYAKAYNKAIVMAVNSFGYKTEDPVLGMAELAFEGDREGRKHHVSELKFDDNHSVNFEIAQKIKSKRNNFMLKHIIDNMQALGFQVTPLFDNLDESQGYFFNGSAPAIEIIINQYPIIETKNITWEQVLNIRNDKESKMKLNNFRMFLYENYSNKDPEYIIDNISARLEDYKTTCEKHGIKLILTTAKSIIDSRSVIATGIMAIAGAIICNSTGLAIGTISGIVFEIGKMGLSLFEQNLDFKSWKDSHELAFIINNKQHV